MLQRKIPSTGEMLPAIGLGTWQVFNTQDRSAINSLTEVVSKMHAMGGRLIDSSPMYGLSEKVTGEVAGMSGHANDFFYATKVWTPGREQGILQMQSSFQKMKRKTMDLMQIHNLVDWKVHLKTLRQWKEEGKIRYIGITHYTDAMHGELETILKTEPIDFVQFNYSITDRHAAQSLLPLAAERGVATLINRPFGEGALFRKVKGKEIPSWAKEGGIRSWSGLFLAFILAHPAVTCVIPATADPLHLEQNMEAGEGVLPDKMMLTKMIALADDL